GAMLAVTAPLAALNHGLYGVSIAAVNGREQCTLSGTEDSIAAVAQQLSQRGVWASRLAVSHAFHSPAMQPAAQRIADYLAARGLRPLRVPLVLSIDGTLAGSDIASPEYWARQILEPVRFDKVIDRIVGEKPGCVIEVGPGGVLTGLMQGD